MSQNVPECRTNSILITLATDLLPLESPIAG